MAVGGPAFRDGKIYNMREALYWMAVGGLSFWFPTIVVSLVLHQNLNLWMLNVVPLAGVALLGAATWSHSKRVPKWDRILAGIWVLGPVSMVLPSVFLRAPLSPNIPGEKTWTILFCLFPPMTLWMAVLNGMIFSVLFATVVLPCLAMCQRQKSTAR